MSFPSKIICLTEESVETFYLLERPDVIQGVSKFVERPPEAKKLPQVSQFIKSDVELIVSMKPDLVVGFSDIQKDIAKELIGRGLNVLITNQRSIEEILSYILFLGRIIGEEKKALELVDSFRKKIERVQLEVKKWPYKPRVYFEEWDHPRLSCIRWVSELIEICGGENIFSDRVGALAQEREVTDQEIIQRNPDIIFGCWCGKKVKISSFKERVGFEKISAVKNRRIFELPPEIFLQPGPALFIDGIDQMLDFLKNTHP
ncbi:MAG: cobalamin-binding protein [Bacteriovoracaceae bacterium]